MRRALAAGLAGLLLATALAGCGAPAGTAATPTARDDRMRVAGLVETDTLAPLANATVAIAELNLTARSDGLGAFAFPPLEPRVYSVAASHPGYRTQVLVARPETNAGALDFVLQRATPPPPRQDVFHFRGALECGYEAPTGGGSCDGGAGLLDNQTRFSLPTQRHWRTAVVDVVFDPAASPGLDGMRLAVRGRDEASGATQQFGPFHGSAPFTVRLEPGAAPPGGAAPVDGNLTLLQLDAAPQGHLHGQACVPATPLLPAQCARGAGAGTNVQVDLYVTVFYVEPAPEGYTMRTDA